MKVQVCTALVVVLAATLVVEAGPRMRRMGFWLNFLKEVTSDVCGDDICLPEGRECLQQMKRQDINAEMLEEVRTNLTECATDVDFSGLTLDDVTSEDNHQGFITFMRKFRVGDKTQQYALLQCFLERNGQLPTLLSCLEATQTETA
ncbi:uncharacterized protein LOC123507370 [Portunus trituberculatus]|uniref:uncharacterized protein LOC123507370 n=1 Tax=Portunus trituberculatus TaxID=210409 RepID=UPI001E1CB410|nr:uncharacterized protein LOC123507370 [Portunus trituberculatus]